MPGFVSIQPRDVYALVEFSYDEVKKIDKVMDLIEIKVDGTNEEEKQAQEYFVKRLYPFFVKLKKEMENNAPNIE